MSHRYLAELNRTEVAERLLERPIAFLPLGAVEQHGPHLPLGTDVYLAEEYTRRVADQVDGLILPAVPFGYSWVWQDLPGTITVGHQTLAAYLTDVIASVERNGFGMLVLVDGHESNTTIMKHVVRDYAAHSAFPVVRLFYPKMSDLQSEILSSGTWFGMIHACEFETSLMLDSRPDLVDMAKAVKEYPDFSDDYHYGAEQLGNISDSGVFGDPTLATQEKGRQLFDRFVDEAVGIIRRRLSS